MTGVLPSLKALYAAEPDGLFWFAGEKAHPALEGALQTILQADVYGLVPKDYDASVLTEKWKEVSAGAAPTPAQRALFDVALSVAAMRLVQSVHGGRVDPRLVGFDYDVSAKRLDLAAILRSTRDAGGLPAAVAAAEPAFPVYDRLVAALAEYRARAAAGEPPLVPALAARQKKVEPGKPWAGATALAARLRVLGDLAADSAQPETAKDGDAALRRRPGGRRQALPAASRSRARRRPRARDDRRRSTSPWRTACGRSSWPSSASAGSPRRARSRTSS